MAGVELSEEHLIEFQAHVPRGDDVEQLDTARSAGFRAHSLPRAAKAPPRLKVPPEKKNDTKTGTPLLKSEIG